MTPVENSPNTAGTLQNFKASETQPYYLIPTEAPGAHFETIKTVALCSALNRLGFESYVVGTLAEGHYWAPLLTSAVQAAHFKSKRRPLIINASAALRNPLKLGVHVHIGSHGSSAAEEAKTDAVHSCAIAPFVNVTNPDWCFPLPEIDRFCPAESERQISLLYVNAFQGIVQPEHLTLEQVEKNFGEKLDQVAVQLSKAKFLYLYEWSDLAVLARLSGCVVVFVPNTLCLQDGLHSISLYGTQGLAWGENRSEVDAALLSVSKFGAAYRGQMQGWQNQLQKFVQVTQMLAQAADFDACWPQETTDTLPTIYTTGPDLAARADRVKWARLHSQYKLWTARSTLREIDAQIYAEHWVGGRTQALSVVIDQRFTSLDNLADTLDSLSTVLGQAAKIYIASHAECPDGFSSTELVNWVTFSNSDDLALLAQTMSADWVLLLRAGTQLSPRALMEWMLAPQMYPQAQLIYADEDVRQSGAGYAYPFFKPDINVELLRCTNYLGDAVLLKASAWIDLQTPLFEGELYAAALKLLGQVGRAGFGHIDGILFHSCGSVNAQSENAEFELASAVLKQQPFPCKMLPLNRWGTWLVQYRSSATQAVSMVIPTGAQTGYLRDLLLGVERCPDVNLNEIILVCQSAQRDEVQNALTDIQLPRLRIVTHDQAVYNHAAALNLGVREASNELVLIVDDDTEPLHSDWLTPLLGIMEQPDVGCVSPRLVALHGKESKVVGGPVVLGMAGAQVSYIGESQWLDESGVYSRLQLTQDVSAVAGHCFLLRQSDWKRVNGFDEKSFGLFFPVLDFCLKLGRTGKRHVWTPMVGYMHHGGKTIELLKRNAKQNIFLVDSELDERANLHAKWAKELACDPCYNRHLSLIRPYDIESDIVVDWQPKRPDRPRVLAVPLHSGAGQYRVIEPLNALQDAGLAQTSVVMPLAHSQHRLLQPLELLRAAPDRLILQHSVDDGQLGLIDGFKRVAPHIKIVQMVDDLFGAVPEKHPSRQFQAREGHQRMMRALVLSDRMVVTTQPLVDYYGKYVADVHIVPNSLAQQWRGLYMTPTPRKKLRVGWVGAAQHRGDLELITDVVRELAHEVDWVFMGMCTDDIKPHIKEFHAFVSIAEYPKKMASLDLDIAIAPLEDNVFNRCKSNLRLLEYGAMGWPVVCSDVYPYKTNQPPVLHASDSKEDWIEKIRSLYDFGKRKTYSQQINRWVNDYYTLEHLTQQWHVALFDAKIQDIGAGLSVNNMPGSPDVQSGFAVGLVIISATQLSESDFWAQSALGLSIPRLIAQGESIRADVAFNNKKGLPEIFNEAIARASLDEILVFIHDDVWIDEIQFTKSVTEGLRAFDVIGVAGNIRRLPGQTGWCFVDQHFTWDDRSNLSGRVAHGNTRFGVVSEFGPVPAACELLDGVFFATFKNRLIDSRVQFDPQFDFHFYDLDFCRTARKAGLSLGTWSIGLTHQSGGAFGTTGWKSMYQTYAQKWEDPCCVMPANAKQELEAVTQSIFKIALERLHAGKIDDAALLFQEIIKTQPRHAGARYQLGLIANVARGASTENPDHLSENESVLSTSSESNIRIYQIYYSEQTRLSNDPGFLQLNNIKNPRPDWREYWPIREFIKNTILDDKSYYGFLSPKFFAKTKLDSKTVVDLIKAHQSEADVFLFSPFFDQGAFYLNIFEQAIDNHQNISEAIYKSLQLIDPAIDLSKLVMSSDDIVFSNYFIAKPSFWRVWFNVCERLFAIAEENSTPLARQLNFCTNHNGNQLAPNKVFVIERVASLLLCTQRTWRVKSFYLKKATFGNQQLGCAEAELMHLDEYKRSIAFSIKPDQIKHFYAMRETLFQQLFANFDQSSMNTFTETKQVSFEALKNARDQAPRDPIAHNSFGAALVLQQRYDEARASFEQAVSLNPAFTKAWLNLSLVLELLKQPTQALQACQSALAEGGDEAEIHLQMANLLEQMGRLSHARISSYRAELAGEVCRHAAQSKLLNRLNLDPLVESAHLLEEHFAYGTEFAEPLGSLNFPYTNSKNSQRVLQIGFVLADVNLAERAQFLVPLFEYLRNSRKVGLHSFYSGNQSAFVLERLQPCFSRWHVTDLLNDEALARLILAESIDILFDLSGHSEQNRLLTFARKPAPVQASWLGYLGTSGVRAIDYYVADTYWLPGEQFENQFVEKLAYLPSVVTFDADAISIGCLPALETSILTFACLDDPQKINATVIAVWSMLLRSVPVSKMLLGAVNPELRASLIDQFKHENIASERVHFLSDAESTDDLRPYDQVDICLDTYPSSGVLTTANAAWMGVPTLCLTGQTASGRFSAALMHQLGLDDFVADGFEELVHIGRYWAENLGALAQLRNSMRERFAASTLGNPAAFGQAFEDMLTNMWRNWCEGTGVKTIQAEPAVVINRPGRVESSLFAPELIVVVSASRMTEADFWSQSALGLSLQRLARQGENLQIDIVFENKRGLSEVYNAALERAQTHDVLAFVHDDIWIDDYRFSELVHAGLKKYDVVGVLGNQRLLPRQPAWCFKDLSFTSDDASHFSGQIAHGTTPFGRLLEFGQVPSACELLDGVFLAVRKGTLESSGVRFDPQFEFQFHDLDFCRSAKKVGLTLGTIPLRLTHQNEGVMGANTWDAKVSDYLNKWEPNSQRVNVRHLNNSVPKTEFPLVSIVIPTHNRPDYLEIALKSALSQTYPHIQIVISDNSDDDLTSDRIRPYLEVNRNIIYFKKTGMSFSDNWKTCLELSSGEYINYLMDDDVFHPDKISRMMYYFMHHPKIGLVTSYRQLINENGDFIPQKPGMERLYQHDTVVSGRDFGKLMLTNNANLIGEPTTVLIRRADVGAVFGVFEGRKYIALQDMAMWLSILKDRDFVYISDALSYFRIHSGQDQLENMTQVQGMYEWLRLFLDVFDKKYFFEDDAVFYDLLSQKLTTFPNYFAAKNQLIRNNKFLQSDILEAVNQGFHKLLIGK